MVPVTRREFLVKTAAVVAASGQLVDCSHWAQEQQLAALLQRLEEFATEDLSVLQAVVPLPR